MVKKNLVNNEANQEGFTLVELIIVMAILTVLAGIAFPRFSNVLESSKVKADVASRDLIQNTVDLYRSERDVYPAGADFGSLMTNATFVGSDAYLKSAVVASHPDGRFSYTVATGKVAYLNDNDKYDTESEIQDLIPSYHQ